MIFQAKNILEPKVIQAMYQVRQSIEEMVTPSGASWLEMCIKIPGNKEGAYKSAPIAAPIAALQALRALPLTPVATVPLRYQQS